MTAHAADLLANIGHEPEYGARPLRRTIQRELDDRLADMLLSGTLNPGETVRVDAADGHLNLQPLPSTGPETADDTTDTT
ncbi:hypothetical protein [Streptomyces flavidovirens]